MVHGFSVGNTTIGNTSATNAASAGGPSNSSLGPGTNRILGALHNSIEELRLLLLQRHDLLLHRSGGYQAVDHHRPSLPDPVGAINCLFFGLRVPPWVKQEHVVRLGESQANSARLQGYQEDIGVTVAERVNHFLPVRRRTVQISGTHCLGVKCRTHAAQVPSELAEDESFMPLCDHRSQYLQQHLDLCRVLRLLNCRGRITIFVIDLFNQRRVERHLPQDGQRAQRRKP